MLKHEAAAYLAGLTSEDSSNTADPTNVHVISGEVSGESENGKVLVSIDGMMFSEDDDQYVEVEALGGLEDGDVATILLTGESGHGMAPFALGTSGTVDRVKSLASRASEAAELAQETADAAQEVAEATNQHFFSDENGIHVTEETQEDWNTNHGGANVLINAIGQLFRDGLNNLLTLTTENGARALTVWDGLGNAASNIRAIIGEVITLGPVGSVQMILSSTGLEIDNESGDGIFSIDSGSTGSVMIALETTLVAWSDTTDVATTVYTVSDTGAVAGDVVVTVTVDGTDYSLDSTYSTATVTSGTGVSVALTSAGVTYVQGIMADAEVTTGELSVEYQHAVTDIALLALIGRQSINGEGESLRITNNRWVANTRQSSTLVRLHNAITGRGIKLGVSSNGYTRGMWDSYKGDWIVARNKDNKTVINGTNFSVDANGVANTGKKVVVKGNRKVALAASVTSGSTNRGLWDETGGKWIIYQHTSYGIVLGNSVTDTLYSRTATCTVNTTNATIANNVNYCWNNAACCSVVISINLKASMANNNLLEVATAPSGYRPPHTFYGSAYVTGQTVNLQTRIDEDGKIYVNNRSGSTVTTSANIYLSFTFAP